MKIQRLGLIYLCLLPATIFAIPSAFTHTLSGGRMGDQLISYAQCKYLAWKHNIPMFYRHFKFSDQFIFSSRETALTNTISKAFKHTKNISHESTLNNIQANTLYNLSYKIKMQDDIVTAVWKNPEFQSILKVAWQPRSAIRMISLPTNKITVAVHIRKASGRDYPLSSEQIYPSNFNDKVHKKALRSKQEKSKKHAKKYSDRGAHALKFPPEQYYIDQLIFLSELLDNPQLYVYIFTDSKETTQLAQRLEKHTNKKNITFNFRNDKNNSRTDNVSAMLQDFYDMTQFDIIIRADSNFSKAAQLIGDHLVGVCPHTCHWENNRLIIDESCTLIRHNQKPYVQAYILPQDAHKFCVDLHHAFFS